MAAAAGGLGGGGMGDGRFSVLGRMLSIVSSSFSSRSLFLSWPKANRSSWAETSSSGTRESAVTVRARTGMIHIPAAFGQSHGGLTDFSGQIAGGVQPLLPDDIPKGGVPYGK